MQNIQHVLKILTNIGTIIPNNPAHIFCVNPLHQIRKSERNDLSDCHERALAICAQMRSASSRGKQRAKLFSSVHLINNCACKFQLWHECTSESDSHCWQAALSPLCAIILYLLYRVLNLLRNCPPANANLIQSLFHSHMAESGRDL